MDGILVVDKPSGWTSFDVVAKLRRLASERRIGHAGTLDPPATGVLVVCLGASTRLVEFIGEGVKKYRGVIRFGSSTETDDATGDVLTSADPSGVRLDDIHTHLQAFVGTIDQMPPRISAIKVSGQRAYALARAGQVPKLNPRKVRIDSITVVTFDSPDLTVEITCGGGTYVRSIARDLGELLGVGGHLLSLVRLAVGNYRLEDAVTMPALEAAAMDGRLPTYLLPPASAVKDWPSVTLDTLGEWRLRTGQTVPATSDDERVAAYDGNGTLVALLQRDGNHFRPRKVFARVDQVP